MSRKLNLSSGNHIGEFYAKPPALPASSHWQVVRFSRRDTERHYLWWCLCLKCGRAAIYEVREDLLRKAKSICCKSCAQSSRWAAKSMCRSVDEVKNDSIVETPNVNAGVEGSISNSKIVVPLVIGAKTTQYFEDELLAAGLGVGAGMAPPGEKNLILVGGSFDLVREEENQIRRESGHVGLPVNPESIKLRRTRRSEVEGVSDYVSNGIVVTIRFTRTDPARRSKVKLMLCEAHGEQPVKVNHRKRYTLACGCTRTKDIKA